LGSAENMVMKELGIEREEAGYCYKSTEVSVRDLVTLIGFTNKTLTRIKIRTLKKRFVLNCENRCK
jgi:hypothetical protein